MCFEKTISIFFLLISANKYTVYVEYELSIKIEVMERESERPKGSSNSRFTFPKIAVLLTGSFRAVLLFFADSRRKRGFSQ